MSILGSCRARGVVVAAMVVVVGRAEATVTQVDGTIIPVTPRMQAALDSYETPAGSLDAVKDAAEVPQIFRPRLTAAGVVFKDIRETASFEDSFGWYNVGDDVSTAAGRLANLHPVMGCGVPMVANGPVDPTHHIGDPTIYVQSAEEPNSVTVDFTKERTAGRYKGGFIGFYLITPEGHASSVNCGDFKNGSDGKSLFGFIYFTQKDLNNDGDFVHHLVYTSRKVADRFFFGFEDLFRGGDNDFEDMAMQIEGLTPPCVPSGEICDGIDNDCDGVIDNSPVDAGTSCTCTGGPPQCDNGPQLGMCQTGVTVCKAGALTCHSTVVVSPELCDGLDNNCNGIVDDNPAGINVACDGQDADLCKEGLTVCQNGALVCNDNTTSDVEICDGIDNNCDGQIDEGDPGGGGSCGNALGACTPGTMHCVGGFPTCVGGTGPRDETCNGLDDDCDGVVDDHLSDTGAACGTSDVGACHLGSMVCDAGSLRCAGEIGPSAEVCNNIDDDCNGTTDDNPVDAGQPCGSSIGACQPGAMVCVMGALMCTGGVGPTAEICNGIDDDCNGLVDDGIPDGGECGAGNGACSAGHLRCIAGAMQCVGGTGGGTEVCNGIDDNCDGRIDEGDLCNGGVCDHGVCAAPCLASEFPCPTGKMCNADNFCVDDPCFGVTCPNAANGDLQACRDGVCQSVCPPKIPCRDNLVCRGSDGACVADTCDYLPKCSATEICVDSMCQANPCQGVSCPSGEFCRAGGCVASCQGVSCSATQTCKDGACVATGCAVDCGTSGVCNPDTGACQNNRCAGVICPQSKACEPLTGRCIADPCQGVTCPSGQACAMGQCGGTTTQGGHVTTGGGGGCSTGGSGSPGTGLAALALMFALGRSRLRARSRRSSLPVALAATLALAGCRINDYCLECETGSGSGSGDGGTGGGDDGGTGSDDGGAACDPNAIRPEVCNHVDDNCDGQIDEGFDLQTDPLNCGACGVQCNKPGAQTRCIAGSCAITGCFPGFHDKDGDTTTQPYAASNGCEYLCFESNGGVEACDGLDNNCDGQIDETIDLASDPANCGVCGRTCEFFGATAHCTNSECRFEPATDCLPGFVDLDGLPANGCEYQCTPTGAEVCDSRDNNCDGRIDETFDLNSDPANCGKCGRACEFANATASCVAKTCRFDPATDCKPGFVDANGNQLDGCEYACVPTNGGVEICDGLDNDCNGVADDHLSDTGGACASTGTPTGACIANGTLACAAGHLVCAGATDPTPETCNGIDDNCDGHTDEALTRSCYDGTDQTRGKGACHDGVKVCTSGSFGTACPGQVLPSAEQCNGVDDDCNGLVDDAPDGGVITASCYDGPDGTAGVGTCKAGMKTCAFGALSACAGEVMPRIDVCGDGLDTDCDGKNDAAEGCLVLDAELRIDAGASSGGLGEATPGAQHSYDLVLARGGFPLGTNVYAVWSQLGSSGTDVYLRKSRDGGKTWGEIIDITNFTGNKVKPTVAVRPAASAAAVDRIVVAYQVVSAAGTRDIHVQVSTTVDANGTPIFATNIALDATAGQDALHPVVALSASTAPNTCVVAWERLNTTTLNRDVVSRTSTNGCASFAAGNPVVAINASATAATRFAGRPQVAITSTGRVVWAWREQRTGSTRDIFAAATASPTTAPTTETRIDGDTTDKRESDFPVLRVNEASAYLVWQDVSTVASNVADVMFARSTDGGATWGAERSIDEPNGSASFTPSIAIDPRTAGTADDVVAIAWEDHRQGTQVYTSVSSDGGATFSTPVRASSESGDPIIGQTSVPQIAAPGGGALAVVYQNQQTGAQPHIFVATSIDTGASWTFTEFRTDTGVGPAINPQIIPSLLAGKPAAVSGWTDFRGNQTFGDLYVAVSH